MSFFNWTHRGSTSGFLYLVGMSHKFGIVSDNN